MTRESLDEMFPGLYEELRVVASNALRRERSNHTLRTTSLVHEAYMRLASQTRVSWGNRTRVFGAAAGFMRRILVDHARRKNAEKRNPVGARVALTEIEDQRSNSSPETVDLVALDEALGRLAEKDGRQARVVELRYFGGLTIDDTAKVLNTSVASVSRDWTIAKAWLFRELKDA